MHLTELITNIVDLYKPALNTAQIKFYAQFLSRYTDSQLDELWDLTTEKHLTNSPPSIGRLKEYAKDVTPLKVVHKEADILGSEEIFSTRLGKLSLLQGWSGSYLEVCSRDKIPEQTDDVLLEFQKAQHKADSYANELRDSKSPFDMSLVSLWDGMIARNKKLQEEYQHVHSDNLRLEKII